MAYPQRPLDPYKDPSASQDPAIDDRIRQLETELAAANARLDSMTGTIDRLGQRLASLYGQLSMPGHMIPSTHQTPAPTEFAMSASGFPFLPRNSVVRFDTIAPGQFFLGAGWWPQEDWGVWGKGESQSLRFCLDQSYVGGYVDAALTLRAFIPPDRPMPKLQIVANGYLLGSYALRGAEQRLKVRIPPACIGDGNIFLHLHFKDAAIPAAVIDSIDERMLGIGLIELEIL